MQQEERETPILWTQPLLSTKMVIGWTSPYSQRTVSTTRFRSNCTVDEALLAASDWSFIDKVTTRYTEGKKSNPVQMVSQMVVVVDQHGAKTILHEAENQNEMFFLS